MTNWNSPPTAAPIEDIQAARERLKAVTGIDTTPIVVMLNRAQWQYFLSRGLIDEEGFTQGKLREDFGHVRCLLVESLAIDPFP